MRQGRRSTVLPASLERLRRRFESWRQVREKGTRIPEELWQAAREEASRLGVNRVSRALRLNYNDLRKRLRSPVRSVVSEPEAPSFIEMALHRDAAEGECVVEVESPDGSRMKLRFRGKPAMDVVSWSRSFWRPGL